jgi:hypothetical protein
MHPLDNDTCTGAPSDLCFSNVAYNMAPVTCRLEDISDTSDPKTNEQLNEANRLLHVTLEQQAESSASQRRATFSRPSQMTATANGGHSDVHAPPVGGSSGDTSNNGSDWP